MITGVGCPIISSSVEFREKIFLSQVILICINVNLYNNDIEQLKLFVKEIHNMTDLDESVDFITNLEYGKVFIIVGESRNDYIISILNELDQTEEIYIYCTHNTEFNHQISNNYSKYRGIFYDFKALYQQIERATRKYVRDAVTLNLISDKKASTIDNYSVADEAKEYNTQEASFMYHRLIMTTLMEIEEEEPKEMIDFCRTQYANNESALLAIQEFEQDYQNQSPIWWYTREGFLYKILNKSLREQDIYTLYALRIFIFHLYNQICKLFVSQSSLLRQEINHNNTTSTIMTFYRGQQMNTKTFERIKSKTGGLLSFTNFLSTTKNRDLAVIYAGNTLNDQHLIAVLFQISVDIEFNEEPFAKIDQISYFGRAEEEYLFAMGSIFRIERVEKLNDNVWNIYLQTTNEFDSKLNELTQYLIDEIQCNNRFIMLGKILWKLDNHKEAEFFYLKALETETNWEERASILQELGTTCIDNSKQALDYFHQALEIVQKNIQVDYHPIFSSIYNNIGATYQTIGDNDLALVYYKESLARELCNSHRNKRKLSTRYNNIGMILLGQGQKAESEHYLRQALDIALEILPSIHPDIAVCYHNLASCMSKISRMVEAVEYEQKAVDIDLHCLPLDHPQTQNHQSYLKSYEDALKLLIDIASLNKDEGCVGVVLKDMTFVYPRQK